MELTALQQRKCWCRCFQWGQDDMGIGALKGKAADACCFTNNQGQCLCMHIPASCSSG